MKKKIIIISASVVILVCLISIILWGIFPIKTEEVVNYKKLKSIKIPFVIPQQLPFEGKTECTIYYPNGKYSQKLINFEKNNKKICGYKILLSDDTRKISINKYPSPEPTPQPSPDGFFEMKYKEADMLYLIHDNFDINGVTIFCAGQYLIFEYLKNVNSDILKNDITALLDQFVK